MSRYFLINENSWDCEGVATYIKADAFSIKDEVLILWTGINTDSPSSIAAFRDFASVLEITKEQYDEGLATQATTKDSQDDETEESGVL